VRATQRLEGQDVAPSVATGLRRRSGPPLPTSRNSYSGKRACFQARSRMARPGLEPGTPRFSGERSSLLASTTVLETPCFAPFRSTRAMFANCGLLPPIRGMERASSPGFPVPLARNARAVAPVDGGRGRRRARTTAARRKGGAHWDRRVAARHERRDRSTDRPLERYQSRAQGRTTARGHGWPRSLTRRSGFGGTQRSTAAVELEPRGTSSHRRRPPGPFPFRMRKGRLDERRSGGRTGRGAAAHCDAASAPAPGRFRVSSVPQRTRLFPGRAVTRLSEVRERSHRPADRSAVGVGSSHSRIN